LVTGGTGYLGRAVVRALVARGHVPVVFARSAAASGLPGVLIAGDVRDRAAFESAAARCDAICHMAALVSVWRRRREDFDEVNVGGLRHALAVAGTHRIARVLYTSSFLARPPACGRLPHGNDYQRTKIAAEQVAAEAASRGAPIIRLYPGVVYGPGETREGNLVGRMMKDHLARRLPGLIGPERVWSLAFVDDVAAGHVAALERARLGAQYGLGGENVPQITPFEFMRERIGTPLPRRIPYAAADLIGRVEVARGRWLGGAPRLTPRTVDIFRHDWPVDSSAAVRDLDYAITPLREGLSRTLADLQESERVLSARTGRAGGAPRHT
jgi:farnesol dehydrogenase